MFYHAKRFQHIIQNKVDLGHQIMTIFFVEYPVLIYRLFVRPNILKKVTFVPKMTHMIHI